MLIEIASVEFVNDQIGVVEPLAVFHFSPKMVIYYKVHKKIYIKYKSPLLYRSHIDKTPLILLKKPLELIIEKSQSSIFKERKFENVKGNAVDKIQEKVPEKSTIAKIGTISASITLATAAIFIRYFVVVDILINLFGKINVELGPKIGDMVKLLKTLQFPNLGFTQESSPIDDGGDEAIQNHEEYLKTLKKNKEQTQKQSANQNVNRALLDGPAYGNFQIKKCIFINIFQIHRKEKGFCQKVSINLSTCLILKMLILNDHLQNFMLLRGTEKAQELNSYKTTRTCTQPLDRIGCSLSQ